MGSDPVKTEDREVRPCLRFDRGTLVLDGLGRTDWPGGRAHAHWTWDTRDGVWRCDAMWYAHGVASLQSAFPELAIEVQEPGSVSWPRPNLPPLRHEQGAALSAWLATKRGVLVMPTGTGKTEVALAAMHEISVPTLVVSPVRDLMYQWHDRIQDRLGYHAGILGDSVFDVRPVTVTTYDSACIHMERIGDHFALLIFDECHHLPGPVRRDAAVMSTARFRMGLSATPERSDSRHVDLASLIGPIVYNLPLPEVKGRSLADYQAVRIPVRLSAEERRLYDTCSARIRGYMTAMVREKAGYGWNDVCVDAAKDPEARRVLQARRAKEMIEDRADEKLRVLEDLFRLHAGEPVMVFTGTNAMAREISRRFLIPCLLHHCGRKERKDILDGFRDGSYPAIVANQVLDEGVDIPEAKVAVVLGGTASTRQAKQRLGRILRKRADRTAMLYEVVCEATKEEERSRTRRRSDAYPRTRARRI